MCRHAAYVGPPVAGTALLRDLPHCLKVQSYAARELLTGVVCADGYGAGWYDEDAGTDAARYACADPIWSDTNLDTTLPHIRSGTWIAAVRNATVAGQNTLANCAPFAHGRHLWSLNGFLDGFVEHWRDEVITPWITPERRQAMHGDTDAEYLFAAWLSFIDQHGTDPAAPLQALQHLVRRVTEEAERIGAAAHLNILASDGRHVYATRAGSTPTQNSLYLLHDGDEFPDGWVVASEPLYDDPLWEPVAPDTVLALTADAPPVRLHA